MGENVKKKKKSWTDNFLTLMLAAFGLMTLGELVGELLIEVPIGMIYGFIAAKNGTITQETLTEGISVEMLGIPDVLYTAMLYLVFIGIWIVILLWCLFKKNRPIYRAIGCGKKAVKGNNIKYLLLGLLIGFAMNGTCILIAYLHKDFSLTYNSIQPLSLIFVFVAVFIQSSAEELLCRGYLMQRLLKNYKPWVAILLSSLFFAALHLGNDGVGFLPILDIFLTGVLFALMVYYMDSIWVAFATHAMWNYCQNIIFGLPNSGMLVPFSIFKMTGTAKDSFAYNTGFGVEGSIVSILVQALAALLVYLWGSRLKKKPTDIWEGTEFRQTEETAEAVQDEQTAEMGQGERPDELVNAEKTADLGQVEQTADLGQVEQTEDLGQVEQTTDLGQVEQVAEAGQAEKTDELV